MHDRFPSNQMPDRFSQTKKIAFKLIWNHDRGGICWFAFVIHSVFSKSKLWRNNRIELWCRLWPWSKTTNSRKVNKSGECLLQLSSSQPLPGLSQLLYLFVYFLLWKALRSKHDQNFQSRKVSFERERLSKQKVIRYQGNVLLTLVLNQGQRMSSICLLQGPLMINQTFK